MSEIVLVLGGSRSGKTSFALGRGLEASKEGGRVYIATAQPLDKEMEERIGAHRRERGSLWETVEEPLQLGLAIMEAARGRSVLVIDCLTLWLSNLLCADADLEEAEGAFIDSLRSLTGPCRVFIVSNEVGMGIVPDNETARRFRDMAGRLNQRVAGLADEVYLMAAGIPVKIK